MLIWKRKFHRSEASCHSWSSREGSAQKGENRLQPDINQAKRAAQALFQDSRRQNVWCDLSHVHGEPQPVCSQIRAKARAQMPRTPQCQLNATAKDDVPEQSMLLCQEPVRKPGHGTVKKSDKRKLPVAPPYRCNFDPASCLRSCKTGSLRVSGLRDPGPAAIPEVTRQNLAAIPLDGNLHALILPQARASRSRLE